MVENQDVGRVGKPTGLSQVEPLSAQGLDPMDFDPSREVIEMMARAMFDCYHGYNAETQERLWQMARYSLMSQAERALAIVSRYIAERAIQYDREANLPSDRFGYRKMQGAALAVLANDLSGFVRRPRDCDESDEAAG